MRISELAERVRVPVSTIRFYERIGLMAEPDRTASGYRNYDEDSATRLLFISRARGLGLTCEQIADLVPVWDGNRCATARERVTGLIAQKQAEIAARIAELAAFADELAAVGETLAAEPVVTACRADLGCCVPRQDGFVPVESLSARSGGCR